MEFGTFFSVKRKNKNESLDAYHTSGEVQEESTRKSNKKSKVKTCEGIVPL